MILLKFLQYEEFFAYLIVKAGFLYCLLKNIEAESGRKEVMSQCANIVYVVSLTLCKGVLHNSVVYEGTL